MTTPGRVPLRLWLQADRGRLAGLADEGALAGPQARLRQLRGDVELTAAEILGPDIVGVVLIVPLTVRAADMDGLVADLRTALGIGPGESGLLRNQGTAVRGIGGEVETCAWCGAVDGAHAPGCPQAWGRSAAPA